MKLVIHNDEHFYILVKVIKFSMINSTITVHHRGGEKTVLDNDLSMRIVRLADHDKILDFIGDTYADKNKNKKA